MAGKHTGASEAPSALGVNYIPGSRIDRAFAEGRAAGIVGEITGTDDTSIAAATMTNSIASPVFPTAGVGLDGRVITNVTISTATTNINSTITANTGTVVTGILSGSGNWDSTNAYHITGAVVTDNPHVAGTDESTAWIAGLHSAYAANKQYETDRA